MLPRKTLQPSRCDRRSRSHAHFLWHLISAPFFIRGSRMTLRKELVMSLLCAVVSSGSVLLLSTSITAKVGASGPAAKDPGMRAAAANAGTPLSTLSADQL